MVAETHPHDIELFEYVEGELSAGAARRDRGSSRDLRDVCAEQVARGQRQDARPARDRAPPASGRLAARRFEEPARARRGARASGAGSLPKRLLAGLAALLLVAALAAVLVKTGGELGCGEQRRWRPRRGAAEATATSGEGGKAEDAHAAGLFAGGPAATVAEELRRKGFKASVAAGQRRRPRRHEGTGARSPRRPRPRRRRGRGYEPVNRAGNATGPTKFVGPMRQGRLLACLAVLAALALPARAHAITNPQIPGLQVALKSRGFYPGAIDGIAGPMTASGVRRFQRSAGIVVDGVAGPITRGKLGRLGRPLFGKRHLILQRLRRLGRGRPRVLPEAKGFGPGGWTGISRM